MTQLILNAVSYITHTLWPTERRHHYLGMTSMTQILKFRNRQDIAVLQTLYTQYFKRHLTDVYLLTIFFAVCQVLYNMSNMRNYFCLKVKTNLYFT